MNHTNSRGFGFYEFFAGGGMVRLGLGHAWQCLFANDFDKKKAAAYRTNFGEGQELFCGDVRDITPVGLPGKATLAWASFPCQDVSLAGAGAGLAGERSGVFWPFWALILALKGERRNPPIVVLENVAGLITSHGGRDLVNILYALIDANYRVGAALIDGTHFVAQSRPRLFIIALEEDVVIPRGLADDAPNPAWHPRSLQDVIKRSASDLRRAWTWWKLPMPLRRAAQLRDVIEHEPRNVAWHWPDETQRLLDMMTPANLMKVRQAQRSGILQVGTVYKRTRNGMQRAEVRFDGVSGCLRTPAGGSSRQIIMVIEGDQVRSRLISPRETARLMGLPESYKLPARYNDAYRLTGDGVVVPAVAWLEQHLIRPLAISAWRFAAPQQTVGTEFCPAIR
jgi:DNA (cytosine-5)-methyltransferase 1